MLDENGNEIADVSTEAPIETEAEPAAPTQEELIPKARLDEVLGKNRSLQEQMQAAQLAIQEANLNVERLRIQYETEARVRAETPANLRQNLSAEEIQAEKARNQLKQLMSESVEGVIKQRFTALEAQFAPLMEVAEQSKRNAFYSDPKVKDLPDQLKNTAEALFNQYKNIMPGVTREIALMFAKGQLYDANVSGATQSAAASAAAVNKVNSAAVTTKANTTASGNQQQSQQRSKVKSSDLEQELLSLANRGYK